MTMPRKEAIGKMHQVLVKRRDALRRALAGDLSLLNGPAEQELEDNVFREVAQVQASQMAEIESRELARIEVALERMRNKRYGICDGCGIKIPLDRLLALPYATRCIKCQREAERTDVSLAVDEPVWDREADLVGEE